MTRIYRHHLRALGYCSRDGIRPFMERHGFDWNDFLANGIDVDDARATGDGHAIAAAELAEREGARNG